MLNWWSTNIVLRVALVRGSMFLLLSQPWLYDLFRNNIYILKNLFCFIETRLSLLNFVFCGCPMYPPWIYFLILWFLSEITIVVDMTCFLSPGNSVNLIFSFLFPQAIEFLKGEKKDCWCIFQYISYCPGLCSKYLCFSALYFSYYQNDMIA